MTDSRTVWMLVALSAANFTVASSGLSLVLGVPVVTLLCALFGLNITTASPGWLMAGSVGGWLIVAGGFAGLGAFCAGMAAAGTLLALASVPAKIRSA